MWTLYMVCYLYQQLCNKYLIFVVYHKPTIVWTIIFTNNFAKKYLIFEVYSFRTVSLISLWWPCSKTIWLTLMAAKTWVMRFSIYKRLPWLLFLLLWKNISPQSMAASISTVTLVYLIAYTIILKQYTSQPLNSAVISWWRPYFLWLITSQM